MNHKERFQMQFKKYVDELGEKLLAFPWHKESAYAGWLAQTYYYVKHTTPLICLTGALFGTKDRKRHHEVIHHLSDEKEHDLLALEDLKNLGWKYSDWPELPQTQLFFQNQYYMLEHQGPHSHLGYSLCLEGLAAGAGVELHKVLNRIYGRQRSNFMRVHAEVDQDHFRIGLGLLKDLTEAEMRDVELNLRQSTLLYGLMLEEIARTESLFKKDRSPEQHAA